MEKPDKSISVAVKIRPLIARERANNQSSQWITKNSNFISQVDGTAGMFFDNIFTEDASTQKLFETVVQPIVVSALKGFNGTIFAYGQTSSGKTYTMIGDENEPGVVPLAVRQIFKEIEASKDRTFMIRVGYFEIYNEKINDLLEQSNTDLKVFDNKHGETNIACLKEVIAASEADILFHFDTGNKVKRVAETGMNERSSRSHAVFRITIESQLRNKEDTNDLCDETATQVSILNLVDLAGSERVHQTNATGHRLKEGNSINKSLLYLGIVIQKLSELPPERESASEQYINYRDSKLTRVLQASLGGNALATIICAITPAAVEETLSTLNFGQRAKCVQNKPEINQALEGTVMMQRMKKEISRLQSELQTLELTKNIELERVLKIQTQIFEREKQFLVSRSSAATIISNGLKDEKDCRRRTWCPTSTAIIPKSQIPQPSKNHHSDNYLRPPVPHFMNDRGGKRILSDDLEDETFVPGENWTLDRTLSPVDSKYEIHTPRFLRKRSSSFGTPNPLLPRDYQKKCADLERQLQELQDFTQLETKLNVYEESYDFRLKESKEQLAELNELLIASQNKVEELELKTRSMDEIEEKYKEMEANLKLAISQKAKALTEKELAENSLSSTEYEYDLAKKKFKARERELIDTLDEARNESKIKDVEQKLTSLEANVKKVEAENFKLQKSLEEASLASQISLNLAATRDLEIERLEKELKDFAKSICDYDATIESLNVQLKECKEQLEISLRPKLSSDANTSCLVEDTPQTTITVPDPELQARIDELESSLMAQNNEHVNLKAINDKLNEKIKTDLLSLMQKQSEIDRIQSESDELSMQVVDNVEENDKLKIKLEEMEEQIQDLQVVVEKCNFIEKSLDKMDGKTYWLEEVDLVEADKYKEDNLVKHFNNLINSHTLLKNQCYSIEADLMKMKELEADAQKVVRELKLEIGGNSKQITEIERQKVALLLCIQNLEDIKMLNVNQTHLSSNNLLQNIDDLNKELTDLRTELNSQLLKKDEKLLELEESYSTRVADLVTEVEELKAGLEKIMLLEHENEKLKMTEKEIETFKEACTKLELDLVERNEQLIDKEQEISELKDKISSKCLKIEELENEILEKMSENLQVRTELETNLAESSRVAKEMNELQTENNKITQALCGATSDQEERIIELEVIEGELREQLKHSMDRPKRNTNEDFNELIKISDLEDKLKDLETLKNGENEKFTSKIHDMETQLCDCLDQLEKSEAIVHDLEQKLILLKEDNSTKSAELGNLEKLRNDLNQQIAQNDVMTAKLESSVDKSEPNNKDLEILEALEIEVVSLKQNLQFKEEDVEALKLKIQELLSTQTNDDSKCEFLESKLLELNQEIQDKNVEIVKFKEERDQKELETIESFKLDIELLQDMVLVKENDCVALKMELVTIQETVESLKAQLIDLHELKSQNEAMRINLEELNQEIHDKNAEIFKIRDEKDIKNSENMKLQETVEQLKTREAHAEESLKKLSMLNNQIELLESSNEKMTRTLVEMNEANAVANSKLDEMVNLQHKFSKLDSQITNKDSKILLQDEKIEQLEQTILELKNLMQAKIAECEDLKSRYKRRSSDSEKKLSEMEIKLNDIMQENGALQYQIASLETDLKKLKNELHFAQDQIPNQSQLVERLQKSKDQMDYDYTVLEEKLSVLNIKYNKATLECKDLTIKLAESTKDGKQQSTEESKNLQMEIDSLTAKVKLQTSENFVHSNKIAKLQECNNDLTHQLKELKSTHIFKHKQQIAEVEAAKLKLLEVEEELKRFKTNANSDRKIRELEQLLSTITNERDNLAQKVHEYGKRPTLPSTPKHQVEQKSKRLSIHDERRRISLWGQTKEISMQTDPTDVNCSCSELNEKVVNLTREVKQKECRVRTLERMNQNHPVEVDLSDCKRLLSKEQQESSRLRQQIEYSIGIIKEFKEKNTKLEHQILDRPIKLEAKIEKSSASTQTEKDKVTISMESNDYGIVMKAEHEQLLRNLSVLREKYEATKKLARSRNDRISELERQVNKENQTNNRNALPNGHSTDTSTLESEINLLKKQIVEWEEKYLKKEASETLLAEKYGRSRTLCNLRMADNKKLKQQIEEMEKENVGLSETTVQMQSKYEQAKHVCAMRKEKIERLEATLSPKETN